jgi:acetylornithine/N-succinyldiaminopimelate aminotransferase
VLTTAKALGGGMPVGACVAAPDCADTLQPGDHGSTFAGGPVIAAAALAAFDVIDEPDLLRAVRDRGGRMRRELEAMAGVQEVRGRGLMIGIGLAGGLDAAEIRDALLADGLVVNAPGPDTIRLLPPLTVSETDVDQGLGKLAGALS